MRYAAAQRVAEIPDEGFKRLDGNAFGAIVRHPRHLAETCGKVAASAAE